MQISFTKCKIFSHVPFFYTLPPRTHSLLPKTSFLRTSGYSDSEYSNHNWIYIYTIHFIYTFCYNKKASSKQNICHFKSWETFSFHSYKITLYFSAISVVVHPFCLFSNPWIFFQVANRKKTHSCNVFCMHPTAAVALIFSQTTTFQYTDNQSHKAGLMSTYAS